MEEYIRKYATSRERKEQITEAVRSLSTYISNKLAENNLEYLFVFSEQDFQMLRHFTIHDFKADMRDNSVLDVSFLLSYQDNQNSLNATLNKHLEVGITDCIPDVGFLPSNRAYEILLEMIVASGTMYNLLAITLPPAPLRRVVPK